MKCGGVMPKNGKSTGARVTFKLAKCHRALPLKTEVYRLHIYMHTYIFTVINAVSYVEYEYYRFEMVCLVCQFDCLHSFA